MFPINNTTLEIVGSLKVPCVYRYAQYYLKWYVNGLDLNNSIIGRTRMDELFGNWRRRLHWAYRYNQSYKGRQTREFCVKNPNDMMAMRMRIKSFMIILFGDVCHIYVHHPNR